MVLFRKQLPDHLNAKLVIACHDERVVECLEKQTKEVAVFVEEVVAARMYGVLILGWTPIIPDGFQPRPEAVPEPYLQPRLAPAGGKTGSSRRVRGARCPAQLSTPLPSYWGGDAYR